MVHGARVAVVIPAFQEEQRIGAVLTGIPAYVDAIYVVDDASTDGTLAAARAVADPRLVLIRHPRNLGVGGAIAHGYVRAAADGAELIAVMAGDGQMDPNDLLPLIHALIAADADYAKGNRFIHPERARMPLARRLGGRALALLTRLTTGYAIDDSQCGFTVIRASILPQVALEELWPRYGYPNDLLALLAAAGARVVEAPVRPIYAGESSGIRPWHALTIAARIVRRWAAPRPGASARAPSRVA